MRIKNIVLIILLGNLVLLAGIQIAVSKTVVYPAFIRIEEDFALRNLERSKDAISRELYHLEILAKDWAYWNDTYEFVENLAPEYIESSLNDDTFVTNNIQAIYYLDMKGKIVWHRIYEPENEHPEATHQVICGLFDPIFSNEVVKGVVQTDIAPLLLVSCGIYDSEQSKPCRGRMIMARFLDQDTVDELIQQTHVKFEIQPLNNEFPPAEMVSQDSSDYSIQTHKSTLVISTTYNDLHGKPAWLISASQDREITRAGKQIVLFSIVITTLILIVLAILLLCTLSRYIVNPIASLTEQIHDLRVSKKLNMPVRVLHGREIMDLAKQFNRLMRRLDRDRTKRHRAEQRMIESFRKEEHANHAKSEFLANMSHELRTPMNSILGFTDLMLEQNLTHEQEDYLRTIYQNGQLLLNLINDVLDMSKIESGKTQIESVACSPIEIAHKLREVARPLAAQKNLEYEVFTSPDLPETIITDPLRLRQILINLVANAVKFTSKGHVYVNIYRSERDTGSYICFSVEDTGIGIPADCQKKIFEAFQQADSSTTRKFGGTGLGLTIAKQLSELMGGEIELHSEPGKGSVFTLSIPIVSEFQPDSDSNEEFRTEEVLSEA